MIKKYLKHLKLVSIDVLIYRMTEENLLTLGDFDFKIQNKSILNGKKKYSIVENGILVHHSFLHEKIRLLKLIKKRGPAIGDCFTNPAFRGKSIYPLVINYIAKELIKTNKNIEIFIVVNKDNNNSIRGIEKAGFKYYASIEAKKWLFFYFKKNIAVMK